MTAATSLKKASIDAVGANSCFRKNGHSTNNIRYVLNWLLCASICIRGIAHFGLFAAVIYGKLVRLHM
jgi:hypothetical protein